MCSVLCKRVQQTVSEKVRGERCMRHWALGIIFSSVLHRHRQGAKSVDWKLLELRFPITKLFFSCFYLHICVSVSALRGQKLSLPLKLELEAVRSYLTWILGVKLEFLTINQSPPCDLPSTSRQQTMKLSRLTGESGWWAGAMLGRASWP